MDNPNLSPPQITMEDHEDPLRFAEENIEDAAIVESPEDGAPAAYPTPRAATHHSIDARPIIPADITPPRPLELEAAPAPAEGRSDRERARKAGGFILNLGELKRDDGRINYDAVVLRTEDGATFTVSHVADAVSHAKWAHIKDTESSQEDLNELRGLEGAIKKGDPAVLRNVAAVLNNLRKRQQKVEAEGRSMTSEDYQAFLDRYNERAKAKTDKPHIAQRAEIARLLLHDRAYNKVAT